MQRTPDFAVSIGGEPLTDYLVSLFALDLAAPPKAPPTISLSVTDNAGGESDKFSLTFARQGVSPPPKSGDEVKVSLGYKETGLVYKGTFFVDRPTTQLDKNGGRSISITATSANMTGKLKEPRHEGHRERKIGDLVKKIAARNNLSPVVSSALASLPAMQADQTHESDMHLLSRLARDTGANFKIADGRLFFLERRGMKTASGTPLIPYTAIATDIISASWEGGEREDFKSVEAGYHDQNQAKRMIETIGSGEPKRVLNRTFANQEQARKAAEAEMKQGTASKDRLSIVAVGNPFLKAEDAYTMPPLEVEYAGDWSIQKVEDVIDKSGYINNIDLERPQ